MNKTVFYLIFGLGACLFSTGLMAQDLKWSEKIGGALDDDAKYLVGTADNGLLTLGTFQDSIDADPGPGVYRLRNVNVGSDATFIQKTNADGQLLWAKALVGEQANLTSVRIQAVCEDGGGNLFLGGVFRGKIDFDPGPAVKNASFTNVEGGFVVKLDAAGNFLWLAEFRTTVAINALTTDETGNLYLGGGFRGSIDADPGPGTAYLFWDGSVDGGTGNDIFLIKWTNDGQYLWSKRAGSGRNDTLSSLAFSKEGNILATGFFMWTVDFDPGPMEAKLAATNDQLQGYIWQLTPEGNFVWVKQLAGTLVFCREIRTDLNGNIIVAGHFNGFIDFNLGAGVESASASGGNIFMIKLDAQGEMLWWRNIGTGYNENVIAMELDELGNIFVVGSSDGPTDLEPGPTELPLTTTGSGNNAFVAKYNFLGQAEWAFPVRGPSWGNAIYVTKTGNIYACGYFSSSIQLGPQPGGSQYNTTGGDDGFVLKLRQDWHFAGNVFYDQNQNNQRDAGELGLQGFGLAAPNHGYYATSNQLGDFHFYYNLLDDTVRITSPWSGWVLPKTYAVPDPAQTFMWFPAQHIGGVLDISITATALTAFRPGFQTEVVLQVKNIGTSPALNIPVKLRLVTPNDPSKFGYQYAEPAPMSQSADLLEWAITSMLPGESATIKVYFKLQGVANGDPVVLSTNALLNDDVNQFNNGYRFEGVAVGSFDPNDKQVWPRAVTPAMVDTTNLTYTIRFQNTGTYPADFVVIRDTLPASLDLATLKVLASSHPCFWRIYGPRVLEFRFDPIHLPDSTSNEPASHGFVVFSAKPHEGLSLGDSVRNRVGIYFDYNDPVITNYATMHVLETVGAYDPAGVLPLDFQINPNPVASNGLVRVEFSESLSSTADIRVLDMQGRTVHSVQLVKGEQRCVLPNLPPGSYFVQADAGGRTGMKLLIIR
ncbi:MAG: T9SS type A sorting domain-containing protein [Saprospiraceae bacterium]|nr:T9SS type A sorting domain-containing protein [Saprospiraceae bacterium]